ncbi:hypothetical protein XENTR_v10003254 [Xenopus tropicalis]|nr:hypothetical protein XENTR_v10003254 [Xenopus tropicalis]
MVMPPREGEEREKTIVDVVEIAPVSSSSNHFYNNLQIYLQYHLQYHLHYHLQYHLQYHGPRRPLALFSV